LGLLHKGLGDYARAALHFKQALTSIDPDVSEEFRRRLVAELEECVAAGSG
jgi:hypothetical protein